MGAHAGLKARLLQQNRCCVGFGRSASDTIGFESLRLQRGFEDSLRLLASRSRRTRTVQFFISFELCWGFDLGLVCLEFRS